MAVSSGVAIAALVLAPFGHLADLLHDDQPFFGYDPQGPVLTLVRAQRVEIPKCDGSSVCACKLWSDALVRIPPNTLTPRVRGDFKAWEPWSKEDLEKIQACDHFSCDVKLDAGEAAAMKKTPEKDRLSEFLSLIDSRVDGYQKTEARKEYEFPGNPVDPWKLFEAHGLKPLAARPPLASVRAPSPLPSSAPGLSSGHGIATETSLFLRILDFAPGKIQKIHQVVDRRSAVVSSGPYKNDSAVWLRDAYTDHYFDSWGEYSEVICDGEQGSLLVLSSVLGEMDMLKKTGFIASLTRPKLRGVFEEHGKIDLNAEFERLKAEVAKATPASPIESK
jgi:hypothetical protein